MRRHPKTRRHWTETEATAVLADLAAAGLALAEFCNQRGLSRGCLAYCNPSAKGVLMA